MFKSTREYCAIMLKRNRHGVPVLDNDNVTLWADALVDTTYDADFCAAYQSFQWLDHFGDSTRPKAQRKRAAVFGKEDVPACTRSL